jgi:hypothetical protein
MADNKLINNYFQIIKHNTTTGQINVDNFDRVKALEESRLILNRIDNYEGEIFPRKQSHDWDKYCVNGNLLISSCSYCRVLVTKKRRSECRVCGRLYCGRHLNEISHSCNIGKAKIMQGKNLFKIRLRQVKNTLAVID